VYLDRIRSADTFGVPRHARFAADAGLAARSRRGTAGQALAIEAVDRPGYFQSHTVFSGVSYLRRREGPPCCILHPQEAGARGLCDGQHVRLFNDHGSVGLVLKVSDEVQPGVVLVPGQRPDGETLAGTVNMLCTDRYTDIGEGATYQSTWLDIAAWEDRVR